MSGMNPEGYPEDSVATFEDIGEAIRMAGQECQKWAKKSEEMGDELSMLMFHAQSCFAAELIIQLGIRAQGIPQAKEDFQAALAKVKENGIAPNSN